MTASYRLICFCAAICTAQLAHAQATSNAITGANDAFGFRKGDEAVGIYDEASARGFNLESAGNYRFHGSYFVKNSGVSSIFLDSTAIRIGYNTLPVILPSPSGVVDYSLRDPAAGEPSLLTVGLDPFLQPYGEILFKHRLASAPFSGALGVSYVPEMKDAQGGSSGQAALVGGTARYAPGPVDLRGFFGEYRYERPSQFRLVTSPELLEQRMDRGDFIGVKDLNDEGQRRIAGVLADAAVHDRFGVGVTAIFSQEDPSRSFLTLLSGLADDGTVNAKVIAAPAQRTTSISSEARAYWSNSGDAEASHRIDLVGRYRRTRSSFGGASITQLGQVPFDEPVGHDRAEFEPSGEAELRDHITQVGAGIAYRAVIGRTRLNAGLLRTHYRKSVTGPGIVTSELDTSAWLYNVSAAHKLSRAIEIYAGYNRGLEEAGIAPASAPNRYEVLPPATARQYEVAAIVRPTSDFQLVVGAFDLQRGYFGADGIGGPYRQLGRVRHRGIELSGAGKVADGLTMIVGGVLLDPVVKASNSDDFRPIGVPWMRLQASGDYEFLPGIHADATAQYTGKRNAIHDEDGPDMSVSSSLTVNAGLRAPLKIGRAAATVRFQLLNLFNDYTWDVSSAGTMAYSPSRRFRLALTTEF